EDQLAAALAGQKGYEHVILTTYPVDHAATALIPERMARQRSILPIGFAQGKVLLAMVNPLDIEAVDDVEMRTGMRVQPVVVAASQLRHAIDKFITSSDAFQDIVESVEELSTDVADTLAPIGGEDVPIVRLVNQLIREAVRAEASDIHIEPGSKRFVVRYRIDGVLNEIMELPMAAKPGVISRIKIMAEMDIAERRRPQDGRIALRVDDRPVDIRVASLPTPNGEALTLRILNSELTFRSIEDIGLSDEALKSLKRMITKPFGALFISGPTGSGKSTTMYGALQLLNQTTAKIITVEDPIEYQMAGITQMAINPKIGLTFAAGLRTILRSDPDVVMVGEIRDPETAEIAVRAALTG
ncbi:MAG: GspE/PulE family protein, partial [Coriobacteriia bacterium]|nr:GspE/PulE family protein [Coriobacteriia bacterium]